LPILAVLIAHRESPWFAFISDDVFLIPTGREVLGHARVSAHADGQM
jgi:hypothetical protein